MTGRGNDARVAVIESDIKHVRELVERNHKDAETGKAELKSSIQELAKSIADLKTDLNERKGAEKLAAAIRMTLSGAIGASVVKAAAWIGSAPIK